jgi:membrane fusion protein (multidrug efflux system)
MSKKLARGLAVMLLAVVLPTLSSCSSEKSSTTVAAAAPAQPTQPVSSSADEAAVLTVSGPLIVEHQLDLLAQRDGVVARIVAEPGARVRPGDLLAQMDDRQLLADLEAARAKTRSVEADLRNWELEAKVLQSDLERAQKMWDAQLITKEQLEHAKFKAEADEWDIQRVAQLLASSRQTEHSLQLEMEKTRITAPFAGLVARRYVRDGQQVNKGDRLFWVTAEGPLRMRFTVPEKLLGRLKRGQELTLLLPDFPAEHYRARIAELSPVVDPASGTFDGMVELVGNTAHAHPGMSATLLIPRP